MSYKGLLDLGLGQLPDVTDPELFTVLEPLHNAAHILNAALYDSTGLAPDGRGINLRLDQAVPSSNPVIFSAVQPLYNAYHSLNLAVNQYIQGGGSGFDEIIEVQSAWWITEGNAVTIIQGGSRRPPGWAGALAVIPDPPAEATNFPGAWNDTSPGSWGSRRENYNSGLRTYPLRLFDGGVAVPGGLHPDRVYDQNYPGNSRLLGIALNSVGPGETVQVGLGPGKVQVSGANPGDIYCTLSYIGRPIPSEAPFPGMPPAPFGQSLLGIIFKGTPAKIPGDPGFHNPRWNNFETYYTIVGECNEPNVVDIYPAGTHQSQTL